MQFQLHKRGTHQGGIVPEFVQMGDKILASAPWSEPGDRYHERFMVFTVRDGKIIDMQGFASHREAERFAARR